MNISGLFAGPGFCGWLSADSASDSVTRAWGRGALGLRGGPGGPGFALELAMIVAQVGGGMAGQAILGPVIVTVTAASTDWLRVFQVHMYTFR